MQAFHASNFDEADLILNVILQGDISSADIIFDLGMAYAKASRFKEALTVFSCLQPYKKGGAKVPYNLGLIHSILGKHELALEAYDLALEIQPDDVEVLINKGSTLNDIKNYALSLEVLENAIRIRSDIPEAWSNKGIALNNLNLCQESLNAYSEAIKLNPDHYEAWSNKSIPLSKLKKYAEALEACDRALSLKPEYAEAWSNKGVTLHDLKRFDEAIAHFDKALSLKSDYHEALSNKGVTLHELKRYDEAIAHYDRALSLKKDMDWVAGDLLHTKMKICSWLGLTGSLQDVSKKVKAKGRAAHPFYLLALNDDASLHKNSSEIYAQDKYPCNPILGPIFKGPEKKKIRIGYFSADFRSHAVSFLTAELFELHDKNRFEITAFSFGADDKSPIRLRLSQAFNQFIDVRGKSDQEVALLARELEIDIAVDLGGHTNDSRTGIFAYRAAPIQVSYIGYLGTMGVEYYDYLLADKIIIPSGSEHLYAEKIAYLPSYQVNDRKRKISDKAFTRHELGLPATGFVFCCFNNNYKILPPTFNSWMQILRAVEGSVLFLYAENQWAEANLKKEAEARGVDSARLVFGASIPTDEYLARYRVCDLFLDTFPYNAGTTASDALWAGLPVLTLMGKSFASRMAASLLNAIGLPRLITNTRDEYESLAIELGTNPKMLAEIRLKLVSNRLTTPLFDAPLFTKNLETAYSEMYKGYRAGLAPEYIYNVYSR